MFRGARDRWVAGLVVLIAGTLLAVSGLAVVLASRLSDRDAEVAVDPSSPASVPAVVQEPDPLKDPTPTADPARGRPLRIKLPALGVDVEVLAIGLQDGVLVPPSDPATVGWWRDGAIPGASLGTALLAGHTYSLGDGAFDELGLLEVGDRFIITTSRGQIAYRVDAVRAYTKAQLAAVAERLFSQTVAGQAVLTTCTDYRAGSYHANTVVIAHPVRSPTAARRG